MKKILLVEDDPFIRDLTSIKLSEHNFAVLASPSGEAALESAQSELPDLILLDLDLPGMTGLEVLEQLKNNSKLKNIPVTIFSNSIDFDAREKTQKLQVTGFFVKASTSFDDLLAHINQVLPA